MLLKEFTRFRTPHKSRIWVTWGENGCPDAATSFMTGTRCPTIGIHTVKTFPAGCIYTLMVSEQINRAPTIYCKVALPTTAHFQHHPKNFYRPISAMYYTMYLHF